MAYKKEISSIVKAAEVMKRLSEGDNQLSGIARKLGYDKSTVHRVLKTLEKVGLASQDPVSLRFYPGPLLHTLSNNSLKSHRVLNEIALKHMEALRNVSQETVNLQIPMGSQRIIMEIVFMFSEYMYYAKPGDAAPLYSGAAGKILLSMHSDKDINILLDKVMPDIAEGEMHIDKEEYIQEIKKVRLQGYAKAFYNSPIEYGAFSAPVSNYLSPIALTIVGFKTRLEANQDKLLEQLITTARNISAELSAVYH